ncbi:hypothetical protein AB3S75_038113 [Citrus x aurantiifolia]
MLSFVASITKYLIRAWAFLMTYSVLGLCMHSCNELINLQKLERAAHDDHEEIECAVCLCKIEEEEIRELRCSHLFHQSCLDAWTAYKYATCPICRDSIAPPRLVTELGEEMLFFNFCSFSSTSQRDKWWLR